MGTEYFSKTHKDTVKGSNFDSNQHSSNINEIKDTTKRELLRDQGSLSPNRAKVVIKKKPKNMADQLQAI